MRKNADAIIVGAGLAGLVAAAELADAGKRVIVLDQEGESSLGGQAFWSLGGLFFVNSPEQRRMRIRDSRELAWQDWLGSAQFDRPEDFWPSKVAQAFVEFSAGEMRSWLHAQGMRWFPVVGWAERGGGQAHGHGNSVPRFHVTWGTGPGVLEPFVRRVRQHVGKRPHRAQVPPPGQPAHPHQRHRHRRGRRTARTHDRPARPAVRAAASSAISSSMPARSSSRPAASAAISTWCARTGRATGSAIRRAA